MLFLVFYRKNERVPTGLTNCLEALVVFIRDDIAIPNLGEKDGLSIHSDAVHHFFLYPDP